MTARGNSLCSLRSSVKPSSIAGTMRDTGTTAMCVSGSKLVVAAVSGPESSINVPVSAMAQKQPVMPTGSSPLAARAAASMPAPAQSSPASEGQQTIAVPSLSPAR